MACRWIGRPNLHEYCACCSAGTRSGCLLDTRDRYSAADYKTPSGFPKGEA